MNEKKNKNMEKRNEFEERKNSYSLPPDLKKMAGAHAKLLNSHSHNSLFSELQTLFQMLTMDECVELGLSNSARSVAENAPMKWIENIYHSLSSQTNISNASKNETTFVSNTFAPCATHSINDSSDFCFPFTVNVPTTTGAMLESSETLTQTITNSIQISFGFESVKKLFSTGRDCVAYASAVLEHSLPILQSLGESLISELLEHSPLLFYAPGLLPFLRSSLSHIQASAHHSISQTIRSSVSPFPSSPSPSPSPSPSLSSHIHSHQQSERNQNGQSDQRTLQSQINRSNSTGGQEASWKVNSCISISPVIRTFNPSRDSRHNFKSPAKQKIYNNREQCRDSFFQIIQKYSSSFSSLSSLEPSSFSTNVSSFKIQVKVFLALLLNENYEWFADLFLEQIIQIASTGETDPEVTNLAKNDKSKLHMLHNRMTADSQSSTNNSTTPVPYRSIVAGATSSTYVASNSSNKAESNSNAASATTRFSSIQKKNGNFHSHSTLISNSNSNSNSNFNSSSNLNTSLNSASDSEWDGEAMRRRKMMMIVEKDMRIHSLFIDCADSYHLNAYLKQMICNHVLNLLQGLFIENENMNQNFGWMLCENAQVLKSLATFLGILHVFSFPPPSSSSSSSSFPLSPSLSPNNSSQPFVSTNSTDFIHLNHSNDLLQNFYPINIISVIEKCKKDQSLLLLHLPWILRFLSIVLINPLNFQTDEFRKSILLLRKLYSLPFLKPSNKAFNFGSFCILSQLDYFFQKSQIELIQGQQNGKNTFSSVSLTNNPSNMEDYYVKPYVNDDLNDDDINDDDDDKNSHFKNHSTSFIEPHYVQMCCPLINELKSILREESKKSQPARNRTILSDKKVNEIQNSKIPKKIIPSLTLPPKTNSEIAFSTLSSNSQQSKTQLQVEFFAQWPQYRRTIDFILYNIIENSAQFALSSMMTKLVQSANAELDYLYQSKRNSPSQSEPNAEEVISQVINTHVKKTEEIAWEYARTNTKSAFYALNPLHEPESVAKTAAKIAIEMAEESTKKKTMAVLSSKVRSHVHEWIETNKKKIQKSEIKKHTIRIQEEMVSTPSTSFSSSIIQKKEDCFSEKSVKNYPSPLPNDEKNTSIPLSFHSNHSLISQSSAKSNHESKNSSFEYNSVYNKEKKNKYRKKERYYDTHSYPGDISNDSNTPVFHSNNSKTPVSQYHSSKSPVFHSNNSKTPVSQPHSSKSPVFHSNDSKTPVHYSHSSKTPVPFSNDSKTPVLYSDSSKSPVFHSNDSKTPVSNTSENSFFNFTTFDSSVRKLSFESMHESNILFLNYNSNDNSNNSYDNNNYSDCTKIISKNENNNVDKVCANGNNGANDNNDNNANNAIDKSENECRNNAHDCDNNNKTSNDNDCGNGSGDDDVDGNYDDDVDEDNDDGNGSYDIIPSPPSNLSNGFLELSPHLCDLKKCLSSILKHPLFYPSEMNGSDLFTSDTFRLLLRTQISKSCIAMENILSCIHNAIPKRGMDSIISNSSHVHSINNMNSFSKHLSISFPHLYDAKFQPWNRIYGEEEGEGEEEEEEKERKKNAMASSIRSRRNHGKRMSSNGDGCFASSSSLTVEKGLLRRLISLILWLFSLFPELFLFEYDNVVNSFSNPLLKKEKKKEKKKPHWTSFNKGMMKEKEKMDELFSKNAKMDIEMHRKSKSYLRDDEASTVDAIPSCLKKEEGIDRRVINFPFLEIILLWRMAVEEEIFKMDEILDEIFSIWRWKMAKQILLSSSSLPSSSSILSLSPSLSSSSALPSLLPNETFAEEIFIREIRVQKQDKFDYFNIYFDKWKIYVIFGLKFMVNELLLNDFDFDLDEYRSSMDGFLNKFLCEVWE